VVIKLYHYPPPGSLSLAMKLSMVKLSQKGILPLPRLDGSPQTLEGTDAQRWA